MLVHTIGFTQKSASRFFSLLEGKGISILLDVRTNNSSQLSGFAKKPDLAFFLKKVSNIDYMELRDLCPDTALLKKYRAKEIDWNYYSSAYLEALSRRSVENLIDPLLLGRGCMLCSEHEPLFCHRRLAAEYLNEKWSSSVDISIKHLL